MKKEGELGIECVTMVLACVVVLAPFKKIPKFHPFSRRQAPLMWVTRPERQKGAKDLQLEVGLRRSPYTSSLRYLLCNDYDHDCDEQDNG